MRFETLRLAGLSAVAAGVLAIAGATSAQAAVVYDTNLAPPGVYYGSGNNYLPGHWAVNTQGGVEIGLRSHVNREVAPEPTNNLYILPLGSLVNFDYSVNPFVSGTPVSLVGATHSITVRDRTSGQTASFDPTFFLFNNATSPLAPGGYQNSQQLGFFFVLGSNFDPNMNNTYDVTLSVTNVAGVGDLSISNVIQVGSGAVPEPATWAMMIMGFGAAGSLLRRRRQALSAA
jgi:hypothetical protein